LAQRVAATHEAVVVLAANHERGRCWREGALVVLAGQVNAGKSSLMNAILGINRALVTDIPGTTRDYLEESVHLDGLPVRLVDTAGLRASAESIEMLGIERGLEFMDRADLVLLVIDADLGPGAEDLELVDRVGNLLVVANKMDLLTGEPFWFVEEPWMGRKICPLSAKGGQGVSELLAAVRGAVVGKDALGPGTLVPNLRQHEALVRAGEELGLLLDDLGAGQPYDILSVRLDTACAILAEITGEILSEDVLNVVFEGFCIGK
jgi:tRNA modification GTPase